MASTVTTLRSWLERNPNKVDHFDHKNFSIFELNDLAFLDYDRSCDRNAVIVLAT